MIVIRKSHLPHVRFFIGARRERAREGVVTAALYLPYHELVTVLGDATAARLVAELGGERAYVGPRRRPGNRIVAAIGGEGADKLSTFIETGRGGMWVELPLGPSDATAERRRRVGELLAGGLSVSEIARELKVHPRTVRRARARLKAEAA